MDAHIERLSKDLKVAAATLSDAEARFLVDSYYLIQEDRKRSNNQVRALDANEEPHLLLTWFAEQNALLESQLKAALDKYAQSKEVGRWAMSIHGIGPVITAGLIAHIDIKKCPTVGHIWRFAGLDPSVSWNKGEKRPWNADLKTLCWKIGQSFMKFSGSDDCFYGKVYRERKTFEIARNDSGANAPRAAELLPKFNKKTEAYKHLEGGKLPPAQIDGRARRYAVKLFLSHFHSVWYEIENGTLPPTPYILTKQGGHAHEILPPNWRRSV